MRLTFKKKVFDSGSIVNSLTKYKVKLRSLGNWWKLLDLSKAEKRGEGSDEERKEGIR